MKYCYENQVFGELMSWQASANNSEGFKTIGLFGLIVTWAILKYSNANHNRMRANGKGSYYRFDPPEKADIFSIYHWFVIKKGRHMIL